LPKEFHYGGQAVFEGVMMLGQRNMAMAVRRPSGDLTLITRPLSTTYTGRVRRIPLLRGIVVLVQTLVLGMRALFESVNIALEGEKQELSGFAAWGLVIVSLGFAVALFFMAPLGLTHLADPHLGSALASNIVEGVIRIGIFFLYLAVINLLPDIRRIFAYHGAEHKTVNAYEDKAPLEVAEVRKYSTAHLRCGTAFLFIVLVIAVVVFALLGSPPMWLRVLSRILLIPVIAAIAYEITHLSARYAGNRLVRLFFIPGLAIQRMTTRQPDDGQIESAICALSGVIEADTPQESG
jgi:uncharacterized protein YqhQ